MWDIGIIFFPGHTDQGTITGTWSDADGSFTFSEVGRLTAEGQVEFLTHAVTHRDQWKQEIVERRMAADSLKELMNATDSVQGVVSLTENIARVVDELPDVVAGDSVEEATVRTSLYEKVKAFLLMKVV